MTAHRLEPAVLKRGRNSVAPPAPAAAPAPAPAP